MSMAVSPTRRCAISPRRWRVLAEGGRLVAITGASLSPDNPSWRDAFMRLQERGRIVFSAPVDGRAYARHGTSVETRLTVIDRVPADDPTAFPASPGMATDAAMLLDWVTTLVPARPAVKFPPVAAGANTSIARRPVAARPLRNNASPSMSAAAVVDPAAVELAYETVDWAPAESGRITEALYEGYGLQSIRIPGLSAAPDTARAIGRHGVGRAAQAQLSAASAAERRLRGPACRTPSSRASSMPARPMPVISPDRGSSMRPSMSSRPRPTMPSTPSASAAAGFWATAPAPARAARSPASCSTIG